MVPTTRRNVSDVVTADNDIYTKEVVLSVAARAMVRRRKSELVPRAGGRSRHAPRTAPPATAQSPGPSTPGFPASAKRGAKEGAKGRNVSTEQMKGRLAIKAATMNLSGQSVMGLTPAYKLNYIRSGWSKTALPLLSSS